MSRMLLRNEEPFYLSHKNKLTHVSLKIRYQGLSPGGSVAGLHNPNVGDLGSIHHQGAGSHMPQLRLGIAKYIFFNIFFLTKQLPEMGLGLSGEK